MKQSSTIEMKHIDVILVSNHMSMLALPYITEESGFKGVVYATDPVIQFSRLYMEEMVAYIERTPKIKQATRWKDDKLAQQVPLVLSLENRCPASWRPIYSTKQLNNSLARVKPVGFNEKKDIFGCLEVTALSSGHSIGSCNWLIKTHHEKIGYISSSSTLTTHPKPIEIAPFKSADLMILNNLTQTPVNNPDSSLGDICVNICKRQRNR